MNSVHPKKLLNSKWTAVSPVAKQRHFIVSEVEFNEEGKVIKCSIEAVINGKETAINWRDLKDSCRWLPGWKT